MKDKKEGKYSTNVDFWGEVMGEPKIEKEDVPVDLGKIIKVELPGEPEYEEFNRKEREIVNIGDFKNLAGIRVSELAGLFGYKNEASFINSRNYGRVLRGCDGLLGIIKK